MPSAIDRLTEDEVPWLELREAYEWDVEQRRIEAAEDARYHDTCDDGRGERDYERHFLKWDAA